MAKATPTMERPSQFKRKPRYRRTGIDGFKITGRDIDILKQVARHRYVRSTHLDHFFPGASPDNLRRRLDGLFQTGHLERPRSQGERYRLGSGSAAMVYALGPKGADLLAEQPGFRRSTVNWTAKARDVSRTQIDHSLQVCDALVAIERACRARGNYRVLYLDDILAELAPPETKASARPYFWSVPVLWNGQQTVIHPIPDKIFGIQDLGRPPGKNRKFFFIELDRGTMPIVRADDLSKSSVLRHMLAYAHSYRAELYRQVYGLPNMRALFIAPGPVRVANIITAYKTHLSRVCPPQIFLLADLPSLVGAESLFDYVWFTGDGGRLRLLD